MRDMTVHSSLTNKVILDTVSRQNEDAAVHLTYNTIKSCLSCEKLSRRPALPNNLHILSEMLESYQPTKTFYKGAANIGSRRHCPDFFNGCFVGSMVRLLRDLRRRNVLCKYVWFLIELCFDLT